MNNNSYIPIERIIEKVSGILPSSATLDIAELVEHVYDATNLIDSGRELLEDLIDVTLEGNNTMIPRNVEEVLEVFYENIQLYRVHNWPVEENFVFLLRDGRIYSDLEDVVLQMRVIKYPVDERGYPLIANNSVFINAITHYVAERLAFKLYIQDYITVEKYSKYERERAMYMGAASNYHKMPRTKDEVSLYEARVGTMLPYWGRKNPKRKYYPQVVSIEQLSDLIKPLDAS